MCWPFHVKKKFLWNQSRVASSCVNNQTDTGTHWAIFTCKKVPNLLCIAHACTVDAKIIISGFPGSIFIYWPWLVQGLPWSFSTPLLHLAIHKYSYNKSYTPVSAHTNVNFFTHCFCLHGIGQEAMTGLKLRVLNRPWENVHLPKKEIQTEERT